MVVPSSPKNFENRKSIRLTWGKDIHNIHRKVPGVQGHIIFQIGIHPQNDTLNNQVCKESHKYGDILGKLSLLGPMFLWI